MTDANVENREQKKRDALPFVLRVIVGMVLISPWLIAHGGHKNDLFFGCAFGFTVGLIVGDLVKPAPAKLRDTLLLWMSFAAMDAVLFYPFQLTLLHR